MPQQDPTQILAQLIAQFASQQQAPQQASQQQAPEQPQQAQSKAIDPNPLQTGVIKAIKEYNKNMENQGKHMAAQALHNGATTDDILGHELMAGQTELAIPQMNQQQPQQQQVQQDILNQIANYTKPRGVLGRMAQGFQQGIGYTSEKLDNLGKAASIAGVEQDTNAVNAKSNRLNSITQYNNSVIDNALKRQELNGTEMSAKSVSLRAGALKDIAEFNRISDMLTPEDTLDRMKKIQDNIDSKLPGYEVTQVANGDIIIRPKSNELAMMKETEKKENVQNIADAIESGNQLADFGTLYGLAGPVKGELQKRGINVGKLQLETLAEKKLAQTLQGPQQVRLRQSIDSVLHGLDELDALNSEFGRTGIKGFNSVKLEALANGAGTPEQQDLAQRFKTQIIGLQDEFGNVVMGGNSPTDRALELSGKVFDSNFNNTSITAAAKQMRRLLSMRKKAIEDVGISGSRNQEQPSAQSSGGWDQSKEARYQELLKKRGK